MNISYRWSVEKLTTEQDKKLVTSVEWRCYGVDAESGFSAAMAGATSFKSSDSFTPFNQLTEEQVLAWCFEPIVTTWIDKDKKPQSSTQLIKDEGEAQVAGQIARQLAQKAAEPALPWL